MEKALLLAKKAYDAGEVPVGALIAYQGRIIGKGYNTVESSTDNLNHAEMIAIRQASKKIKNQNLKGAILYTTLEPCPMCTGAILLSNISTLVYGAKNYTLGSVDSLIKMRHIPHLGDYPEVIEGILSSQAEELLNRFFLNLRRGG